MLESCFKSACLTIAKDKRYAFMKLISKPISINRKSALLIVLLALHYVLPAQHQMVRIDHSEMRKLTSYILKQNFRLDVQLPNNYKKSKKRYPVLYILDGHWLFPMLTGVYSSELDDGAIPEMILVGITWAGVNPNYESFRERNYTPTRVTGLPNSGNAHKFLRSIKKEIIPFIDSNYRVKKNDRTLMAGSFGGLFAAYMLFQDVGLFSRYILASPSLDWDNNVILNYEQHYWEKNSNLNVRIAISGGDLDRGIRDIQGFADKLKSRNYNGLILTTELLQHTGHAGSIPEGLVKGLRTVFKKPSISLDTTKMGHYVGTYQRQKDDSFKLFRKNERLFMQYSDKIIFPIEVENETNFYINGVFILLAFSKDGKGQINGVEVTYDSGSGYYKKVNEF